MRFSTSTISAPPRRPSGTRYGLYESLIEMADALGQSAILTHLEANLQEEEAALQKLKGLAAGVNKERLIAEEDEKAN
jgi:ferritin-like metal-binding protein YciE